MLVQNNFLYNEDFVKMYYRATSDVFPWYMKGYKNTFKFTHDLIKNENGKKVVSPYVSVILSNLLKKIGAKKVEWARLDCCLKTEKIIEEEPNFSINRDSNNYIGILNMDTNNSYVQIVGGDRIESIENRFICFKRDVSFFKSSHTDTDKKITLYLEYSPDV